MLRKRGKLTRAERNQLASYRSSRRRRARALYEARVRAIQARDSALRNIAASNIVKDDSTGEDPEIRRAVVEALEGRSGTVVVMDPTNGRLYTVVNQRMALASPVKPCSTVKLVVGLAALHEEVFDPNQDVLIARNASINLTEATARSNNPFFQVLGRRLGYERVISYAENFGFGDVTGANYPGEMPGFLPEEGEQETGHMSSHGDGFGITAIQLAAFTSAIANGGNLYVPHAPRTPEEQENFEPILKRKIEMSQEDRMRLMTGMIGTVNFGTGKLAYNPLTQIAGKTGTCTGNRDRLGLFTSFSSVDNPKLVVTVITSGSTEAGKRAAGIAGKIYAAVAPRFFKEKLVTPASAVIEIPNNNEINHNNEIKNNEIKNNSEIKNNNEVNRNNN
ncbi:MAG TPA: penicillin-binding transpeptidase domain-containing protein [Blastocatellia bacterium]|nr:penicillin-binding transpeptidase domain-containing protein [Blastocatellia bacterium]